MCLFQTIKYIRDRADMTFKPKRCQSGRFFFFFFFFFVVVVEITIGGRSRFKKNNHARPRIT